MHLGFPKANLGDAVAARIPTLALLGLGVPCRSIATVRSTAWGYVVEYSGWYVVELPSLWT